MTQRRGRVRTKKPKNEQVKTYLTSDQYNALYDLAEAQGKSVSDVLRQLVEKELSAHPAPTHN